MINDKWKELYYLASDAYDLAPWQFIWDTELVGFLNPENNVMYYCSVLGKASKYIGLLFIHQDYIDRYLYLINNNMHPLMLINYQQCFMVSFVDINKADAEDKIKPRELKISFNEKMISFKKYQIGYLPCLLEDGDVDLLISLFNHFNVVFKHLKNNVFNLPIGKDNMIVRYYLVDKKGYKNAIIPLTIPEQTYLKHIVKNPVLDEIIVKSKRRNKELELDFINYFIFPSNENYIDRKYKLDFYYALAEYHDKIIDFEINNINLKENIERCINKLLNWMLNNYIPKKICVRDVYTMNILEYTCNYLNIELEINPRLKTIDIFLESVNNKK